MAKKPKPMNESLGRKHLTRENALHYAMGLMVGGMIGICLGLFLAIITMPI